MNGKKKIIRAFLVVLVCLESPAGAAVSDEFRSLIRARSMDQLASTLKETSRLRRVRTACEAQLRFKKVPFTCFQAMELEERALVEESRENAWLESLCVERVKNSRDRRELEEAASLMQVPTACRSAAATRAADLAYADQFARPAEFFLRRSKVQP